MLERYASRERNAKKMAVPSESGAKVFVWEPDGHGGLVRRSLQGLKEAMWFDYTDKQRWFDPVTNEWDCSEHLGSGEDWVDPYGEEDVTPYWADPTPPVNNMLSFDHEIADIPPGQTISFDSFRYEPLDMGTDTLEDRLYLVFGFCPRNVEARADRVSDAALQMTRIIFADRNSPMGALTNDWAIHDFGQSLSNRVDDKAQVNAPAPLWDMSPTHPLPVVLAGGTLYVRRIQYEKPFYFLSLSPHTVPVPTPDCWNIVVRSPVAALAAIRSRPRVLTEVAQLFVRRGVPFQTVTLCRNDSTYEPPLTVGLGHQQAGYAPGILEYAAYDRKRREFLHSPRGRAALLRGGIVWRLAVLTLRPDDVLSGPSAFRSSQFTYEDRQYWDDSLTEEECNLICGAYRIAVPDRALQNSISSWWPRDSTWMASSLNNNFWTWDNETWFQKRLQEILDGKAEVKTAGQWRASLKTKQLAHKVYIHLDQTSKHWLDLQL